MPTAKADSGRSDPQREILTPEDLGVMMAEAAAVDALFQRMQPGPLQIAAAVMAYLSIAGDDAASGSAPEK
ncbi:hypothetical protein [Hyphomicrobium sp.]|jgi:hypothetical protein|uniref:hypothetical protein n=1 Tax=Hyphomicrobium sp. TaxID=82 RepID=UPI002C6F0C0F|nr:hypothetical protein [Hyphomicrobium sp.]HVZ03796.1 hypothetical protein [Hyphomicrobium sp.]